MKRCIAVFMIALAIAFGIEAFVTARDYAPTGVVVVTVAIQVVGMLGSFAIAGLCIRRIWRVPQSCNSE